MYKCSCRVIDGQFQLTERQVRRKKYNVCFKEYLILPFYIQKLYVTDVIFYLFLFNTCTSFLNSYFRLQLTWGIEIWSSLDFSHPVVNLHQWVFCSTDCMMYKYSAMSSGKEMLNLMLYIACIGRVLQHRTELLKQLSCVFSGGLLQCKVFLPVQHILISKCGLNFLLFILLLHLYFILKIYESHNKIQAFN